MTFDLMELWGHMGFLNKLITVSLILMGLACLTVFFERLVVLARTKGRSERFSAAALEHLEAGDFEAALAQAKEAETSHLAELVEQALDAFLDERDGKLSPLERGKNAVVRYLEAFGTSIRRGMPVLASVGSVAPFVGLLGTVIGIMVAFKGIAASGGGGLSAVAGGISEALVETALGLLVAIPAVLMFNMLSTRMDRFEHEIEQSASRLLELMEDHGDSKPGPEQREAA